MNPSKKILILDISTDDQAKWKEVFTTLGSYESTISKYMDVPESSLELIKAWETIPEDPQDFAAVIIGGSLHYPTADKETPWMVETYSFIRKIIDKKIPLLGICGGLQFTVRALGATLVDNPAGRELGTMTMQLNEAGQNDPLFNGVPKNFPAQSSHVLALVDLDKDWQLLADSEMCPTQAIAIGDSVRLLQFHPEYDANYLVGLSKLKGLDIEASDSPDAHKILQNFYQNFVLGSKN